jgi:hypothetical protein
MLAEGKAESVLETINPAKMLFAAWAPTARPID